MPLSLVERTPGRSIAQPKPARRPDCRAVRSGIRPARSEPIGLLAGSGRFPILFAEAARRQGLAGRLRGHQVRGPRRASSRSATSFDVVGVAKLGKMIRAFRRRGVRQIVMAGKVTKNVIYTPWRIVQLCPDLRTVQWWYRRTRADNRDDSLLLSRDRRVRARRHDVRLGPGLLPGAARERGNSHAPRADRRGAEGHRVRLGDGQGDGPARRRPVGGRQGEGDPGRRGHRGDRPLHRARRAALPGRRLDPRQGRQAPAGHAVRRARPSASRRSRTCTRPAPACWRSRPTRPS